MEHNGWSGSSETGETGHEKEPLIVYVEEHMKSFKTHYRAFPRLTTYGKNLAEQYGAISCNRCVVLFLSDELMHAGVGHGSSAEFRFLVNFGDMGPPDAAECAAALEFYKRDVELGRNMTRPQRL
eukprot:gnl/TRDRNA2_/TRDRNA2_156531_c0_seq2.p1 gnl/TRDRNA2_/TRDRNA2_156531_c0~~gnl/TRDRNA2_/TRDRNA2_156531_c0_seq2.p1  ORF type:complete len:125 (-),score=20.31 gnl/TRDRNA2_/TRDRNA2_156531_c0_seq2:91-465(-)